MEVFLVSPATGFADMLLAIPHVMHANVESTSDMPGRDKTQDGGQLRAKLVTQWRESSGGECYWSCWDFARMRMRRVRHWAVERREPSSIAACRAELANSAHSHL